MVTHLKEVYYKLGIVHFDLNHKLKTRSQLPLMVTYTIPKNVAQTQGWSPTVHRLVPTNPRMAIQQEGSILQNQSLALRLNSLCSIFYFQLV